MLRRSDRSALLIGVTWLGLAACESPDFVVAGSPPGAAPGSDGARAVGESAPALGAPKPRVLVFSRTTGFRHASIPAGIDAVSALGAQNGFDVEATEDPAAFTPGGLARFSAVVFLSTSGEVLDDAQEAAFEGFIASGRGFVGVHAATDTEYQWPFYQRLVGAPFLRHPAGTPRGTIRVVDHAHASTAHLGATWTRVDEWYAFQHSPLEQSAVHVLLELDEDSIPLDAPFRMGRHPLAWFQAYGGGRAFVTALGHTEESFREPAFLAHLAGGIAWATTGAHPPAAIVHELDGVTPLAPDAWKPHASPPFSFELRPAGLTVIDAGGRNQHLTRQGVRLTAGAPYAIDALFTIHGAPKNGLLDELNSFCLNFDVQGEGGREDDLDHLHARALNLDLSRAQPHTGVVKTMGFVDGAFRSTGEHTITGVDFDVEYRMTVRVNVDAGGAKHEGRATFQLTRGAETLAQFEADYRDFPYAPARGSTVRVGANTHGTDWTLRDFRVVALDQSGDLAAGAAPIGR